MSLTLNFELNDRDLEHFHNAMEASKKAAEGKTDAEIIENAGRLLADAQKVRIPDFILSRLLRLDDMIAMLRDEAWALDQADRDRVLSALVYFNNPNDVIADSVPVLGYLDDAVMIEMCVRDLQHELDAYDDFCDFRQRQAERLGLDPAKVGRADWLGSRREELVDRMHQRRERDFGVGYGSSSGYSSGKTYVRAWRPGMFSFR
ncbi:MAG: YkvA family protein [Lysobacterales bacterium]